MDSGFEFHKMDDGASSSAATQAELTRLWARVLEIEHVGPGDDFLLLGGDSLSAAVLFSEVETVFGVTLPIEAIYDEAATIEGMATLIDGATAPTDGGRRDRDAPDPPCIDSITDLPRREQAEPAHLADMRDLGALAKLIALAPLAAIPGRAARASLCRLFAKALVAVRPSRADYLSNAVALLEMPATARALEVGVLAGVYEAIMETLRAYLPWDRPRTARLRGREHIDAALAAGRGVILWNCGAGPAARAGLRCLADTGWPIVHPLSYDHPFSNSWFARTFLNPVVTRIDHRYIDTSVIVHEANTIEVMRVLGVHLDAGKVVRMPSNAAFSNPYELPFLGGTLYLGLGAPTLALLHNAVLVPTFCISDGDGGYDLIVERPLNDGSEGAGAEGARALARQYASILERYVKRHPLAWRNWYVRNTWRADEQPENGSY